MIETNSWNGVFLEGSGGDYRSLRNDKDAGTDHGADDYSRRTPEAEVTAEAEFFRHVGGSLFP